MEPCTEQAQRSDQGYGTASPAEVPERVGEGFACLRCGYDLVGQPREGVCPECGAAVRNSIARSLFQLCTLRTLRRYEVGGLLFLLSIGTIVLVVAGTVLSASLPRSGMNSGMEVALPLILTLATIAAFGGYAWAWILVLRAPELRGRSNSTDQEWHRTIRRACAGGGVVMVTIGAAGALAIVGGFGDERLAPLGFPLAAASATHFLTIAPAARIVLQGLARPPLGKITSTLKWFSIVAHGIVGLPLVILLLAVVLANSENIIGLGFGYLWMVPVYGVWTIVYMVYLAYFAVKIRAEVRQARYLATG
ncbi:MAG: hypothetical protein ACT4PL_12835 [Phycisphaerales bacterium]